MGHFPAGQLTMSRVSLTGVYVKGDGKPSEHFILLKVFALTAFALS